MIRAICSVCAGLLFPCIACALEFSPRLPFGYTLDSASSQPTVRITEFIKLNIDGRAIPAGLRFESTFADPGPLFEFIAAEEVCGSVDHCDFELSAEIGVFSPLAADPNTKETHDFLRARFVVEGLERREVFAHCSGNDGYCEMYHMRNDAWERTTPESSAHARNKEFIAWLLSIREKDKHKVFRSIKRPLKLAI